MLLKYNLNILNNYFILQRIIAKTYNKLNYKKNFIKIKKK